MFSKGPENISEKDICDFETQSREWVQKFIHVHQPFTQQRLGKFNDVVTKQYFRATSHDKALLQLMQKHNRLEYLRDNDAQLPKHHKVTCLNCDSTGHNKLSCTHPCKFCNHTSFRAHLIELDDCRVPYCCQENM